MFLSHKLGAGSLTSKASRYQAGHLLPVLSAAELLSQSPIKNLIDQLRGYSGLPSDHFRTLYLDLLDNYAEFVQSIPSQPRGALCGLLLEGIARGAFALKQFFAHQEDTSDPLLIYGVFTAGLLFDVYKVMTQYKVTLNDESGEFIDYWYPFEGSMVNRARFYKLFPLVDAFQRINKPIAILLARQLMPELGYMWLSSDFRVFADWIEAFMGTLEGAGVISRALGYFKMEDFSDLLLQLGDIPIDVVDSTVNQDAEAFLAWLREAIQNQEIKVNATESGVYLVSEGVLLEQKVFKQFVDVYNKPVQWDVVYQQVGNLFGIAKKGAHDYANAKYFSESASLQGYFSGIAGAFTKQKSAHEGMVIQTPGVILNASQLAESALKNPEVNDVNRHPLPERKLSALQQIFSNKK